MVYVHYIYIYYIQRISNDISVVIRLLAGQCVTAARISDRVFRRKKKARKNRNLKQ